MHINLTKNIIQVFVHVSQCAGLYLMFTNISDVKHINILEQCRSIKKNPLINNNLSQNMHKVMHMGRSTQGRPKLF